MYESRALQATQNGHCKSPQSSKVSVSLARHLLSEVLPHDPHSHTPIPITSVESLAQAQTEVLSSDGPICWAGVVSLGGSSLVVVMEQERMEDGVDIRNNNHDTNVY